MSEVAPQAVEPPADQHVDPSPSGIADQAVKRRPTVFGPADSVVDVLHRRIPAPRPHVPPQLGELVLGLLVERRDAGVDRRPHDCTVPALTGGYVDAGFPYVDGYPEAREFLASHV